MMIDATDLAVTAKEFTIPAWHVIASVAVTSVIGVLALSAAVEGYFKSIMPLWQRLILAGGALCLIVPETITDIIGIVIVAVMIAINIKQSKHTPKPA